MSKLKELIDLLCPNGVEYTTLGNIAEIKRGVRVVKSDLEIEGSIPVYQNSLTPLGYYSKSNFNADTTFVIGAGAAGEIGYSAIPYWGADDCYSIICSSKIISKYVYYQLSNNQIFLKSRVRTASIPRLARTAIEQFPIPIPPIEVQEEIVRILDTFSAHAAELQAELQARKEQYEYYRNLLLTFNPSACGCGTDGEQEIKVTTWGGHSYEITWKTMEEICSKICSGGTPSTSVKSYYNGNIPWMRTQEVDWKEVFDTEMKITEEAVKNSSAKMIPANCVIIAMYGATAAKCCINKIPLTTNQACCNLQINPKIADYRYVYQYICNEYKNLKAMGEGSQSNINAAKIKNYRIPIPPIELQEKIVAILDRFETLVNDLTQGLPAEIATVKEQYEYYRNKLLTFKQIA